MLFSMGIAGGFGIRIPHLLREEPHLFRFTDSQEDYRGLFHVICRCRRAGLEVSMFISGCGGGEVD